MRGLFLQSLEALREEIENHARTGNTPGRVTGRKLRVCLPPRHRFPVYRYLLPYSDKGALSEVITATILTKQ